MNLLSRGSRWGIGVFVRRRGVYVAGGVADFGALLQHRLAAARYSAHGAIALRCRYNDISAGI
eukprot:3640990-Pleurochrysis_carterae.AAC.3